jgi:hypothetical protein
VQIHDMVTPATFARFRHNVLRLHYQSVMGNETRAPYDYFLMACGPVAFRDWTTAPDGLLDFVADDGTYRDRARNPVMVAQSSR